MQNAKQLLISTIIAVFILAGAAPGGDGVPGIPITHIFPESGLAAATPSIVVLPNGHYLVSHDLHGKTNRSTHVHLSSDSGRTWRKIAEVDGQFWSTLFRIDNEVYLLGVNEIWGQIVIRRSADWGRTWTTPKDAHSGRLLEGKGYHCSAGAVVIHQNRIFKCIERPVPDIHAFENWKAQILSAPLGSDLLNAANWTVSNAIDYFTQSHARPGRWYEGNMAVDPNDRLKCILRMYFPDRYRRAALLDVSDDGTTLSFDKMIDFYGSHSKFTIRYDPVSRMYYSVTNLITWNPPDNGWPINPEQIRNVLALTCSPDMENWHLKTLLLSYRLGQDNSKGNPVGFQYADFQIEGSDIIFVLRNAWLGSRNWHDAAWITFHRIDDFRAAGLEDSSMDLANLELVRSLK